MGLSNTIVHCQTRSVMSMTQIGVDETAFKKRHDTSPSYLIRKQERRLFVGEDRKKATPERRPIEAFKVRYTHPDTMQRLKAGVIAHCQASCGVKPLF